MWSSVPQLLAKEADEHPLQADSATDRATRSNPPRPAMRRTSRVRSNSSDTDHDAGARSGLARHVAVLKAANSDILVVIRVKPTIVKKCMVSEP
jgi:hypothetical protein